MNLFKKLLILVSALVVAILLTMVIVSPGQTSKITAGLSPIVESLDVEINGAQQRLLIRSQDQNNPILLHVHGGPGGADQAMMLSGGFDLEDKFTTVYWDQRGAGASYSSELNPETLSLEQIAADGIKVAEYLTKRFGKPKLILQGHSWGTLVSVHMAQQRPDLFSAFIGIGQIANSKRAEKISFDFTMQAAKAAGDQETIQKLDEIGSPPYSAPKKWINTVMVERGLMQPYEMPDGSMQFSLMDIYKIFTFYRGYTIGEKLGSLEGSNISLQRLWMEAINADLFNTHPSLEIPVLIVQGKYDQHTVTEVAKDYFEALVAPTKAYLEFENAAHWPHLRDFDRYRTEVLSFLEGLGVE